MDSKQAPGRFTICLLPAASLMNFTSIRAGIMGPILPHICPIPCAFILRPSA